MGDGVTDRNSFQEPPKVHRVACDFVYKTKASVAITAAYRIKQEIQLLYSTELAAQSSLSVLLRRHL